ncbi:NosD domain-containing protein [Desulfosporosinus sp. OT]|uniref:NosD domain-containing protein n=1 Tax=Desulfosporosinus sp. OT TaxID=913865 RepID=UPI000223A79B|nr:NosD domain-containing protein [Desulfosporosinus sp. OT]EGW38453.1 carbohydrate binding domain protein [Desulfosporosinus sp. OT]
MNGFDTTSINVMSLPAPYVSASLSSLNNEVAFNSAIALASVSSGVVIIPSGNFRISGSINLNTKNPIKFIGSSKKLTTIIDLRVDGTSSVIISTEGHYLSDFALLGNENQQYGINILNVYGKGTILERIVVGNPFGGSGTGFGNATNDGAGIYISTSRYVRIRDCIIGDNYHGIKLASTIDQAPNVCNIYSSDIEHNKYSGIYCENVPCAPTVFGGTLQSNTVYAFYCKTSDKQIKIYGTYCEGSGFHLEGGYCAILHFGQLGTLIRNSDHVIKNVQGIDIRGIKNTPFMCEPTTGAEGIYIDSFCSGVIFEGLETTKQNLIANGNFEKDIVSTGWTSIRATIATETIDIKQGKQCIKLTANDPKGAGSSGIVQSFNDYTNYAGKQVTVGAWVKALSTNSNSSYVQIHSKSGVLSQVLIKKDDTWHYVTISHILDATPTDLKVYFFIKQSGIDTDDVLYIDDVSMAVGKNIFTRFPPISNLLGNSYLKYGTTAQRPIGAPMGFQYLDNSLNKPIWVKISGLQEKDVLQFLTSATSSGNITLTLNGVSSDVSVISGDTPNKIADKVKLSSFAVWSVNGVANSPIITFLKLDGGVCSAPVFSGGTTGVTASIVQKTVGTNPVWMDITGATV